MSYIRDTTSHTHAYTVNLAHTRIPPPMFLFLDTRTHTRPHKGGHVVTRAIGTTGTTVGRMGNRRSQRLIRQACEGGHRPTLPPPPAAALACAPPPLPSSRSMALMMIMATSSTFAFASFISIKDLVPSTVLMTTLPAQQPL